MLRNFKKFVSFALVLAFSVIVSLPAFAESKKSSIPYHMAPGTVITFDSSNKMQITEKGTENSYSESHTDSSAELPDPQPGMAVAYDGAGDPVFITVNGVPFNEGTTAQPKTVTASSSSYSPYNKTTNLAKGAFSWYNTGSYGGYTCATDGTYDNCHNGTQLSASAHSHTITLTKEDVGTLAQYQRILDLRPTGFRAFGYNTSVGVIYNGSYKHR